MAKKKKVEKSTVTTDFTSELIKSLNKEHGARVAYNLALDESPTHVKRWIATGSKQLDYIISDKIVIKSFIINLTYYKIILYYIILYYIISYYFI